jgi:predicted RNase H-like HicB family nuclease
MIAESVTKTGSMPLTAILEPTPTGGFTAEFKEFPEMISAGDNQEEAVRNLIQSWATYLAWRSARALRAGQVRTTPTDALELQLA